MALIVNFGITSSKTHSLCTILIVEGKLERKRERESERAGLPYTFEWVCIQPCCILSWLNLVSFITTSRNEVEVRYLDRRLLSFQSEPEPFIVHLHSSWYIQLLQPCGLPISHCDTEVSTSLQTSMASLIKLTLHRKGHMGIVNQSNECLATVCQTFFLTTHRRNPVG